MAHADTTGASATVSTQTARESRKMVTVVFIDVVDSTVLADTLDPEAFRSLMLRYFDEARSISERHGGFVEKFIGDAVVAIFGIPRLHEDDALRAVTAASEIRSRLAELNEGFQRDWGATISIRTGIETGEAIASGGTLNELSVTGPTVNTAARLEQTAAPGEIVLGEAVYRLVRDAVVAEEIGPLELKGKLQPVKAWRLVEVIPGAPGWARRLDSPLVDRERELAHVIEAFERAAARGGSQIVTVMGPAGAGKSRLGNEAVARLGDRATVLAGRCLPYGEGITFWPVVEILREATGIVESDPPETARAKLRSLLAPGRDGELVESRLAPLLGLEASEPAIQETFWALRRLLETLAATRPVVVVVDDIHWGEPTFLDLLEYLTDWIASAPVVLLCLARPELLEERPGWTGAKPNAEVIALEPLDDAQTHELIEHLVGGGRLAVEAVSRVADVAEGNPLFVEETLRMLVDTGALTPVEGGWALAREQDASHLSIPPTIQALVTARLDRLEPDERRLVERAAVIGKVFGWGAVSSLADDGLRPSMARLLQSLMRKELIRPEHSAAHAEDTFRFAHQLVRDAAYRAIPKADRADLHERLASWLEEATADGAGESDELTGYHLEQAYETLRELTVRSVRTDDLARRAFARLAASGRRAYARGDMPAAVNLLSRATDVLERDDRDRVELLPQLAFALMETGDFARLGEVVAEATELAADDPGMHAHVGILGLWIRLFTNPEGWAEVAEREGEQAREAFREKGDERGLARASSLLGLVNIMKGDFTAAERSWQEASDHARSAGDHRDELESTSWVPLAMWAGPTPSADGLWRTAELLGRVDGDKKAMSSALMARGGFEAFLGDFDAARGSIRRARELLEDVALTVWIAGPLTQVSGWIETLAGDPVAAERELRWGFEKLGEIGEMSWFSTVAGLLGEAVFANGRPDEAAELATSSRESAAPDDVYSQTLWRTVASKVAAARGETDEAERLAGEAVTMAGGTDFLLLQWHALMNLARILAMLGRAGEGAPYLERARAVAARKGSPVAERAATVGAGSDAAGGSTA